MAEADQRGRQQQSIYIIRHGDRFDYNIGKEAWEKISPRLFDPPLSDLGNQQASELGKYFKEIKEAADISHIISSPFLRCIETSNPTAGVLGLPIQLDHCLAEVLHPGGSDAAELIERKTYFPRVDVTYASTFKPNVDESYPEAALERFGVATARLLERFRDKNLILVTHAAGVVAITAYLLKCRIAEVPSAFPASIYRVDRVKVRNDGSANISSDIDSNNNSSNSSFSSNSGGSAGGDISNWSEWKLCPELSGSVAHLSELGSTKKWPNPDPNDPSKMSCNYVDAGDNVSWIRR